ncbi:MAG: glycerol-3-phosphate dehydrogenase [Dongiaceae bacterium]
MADRPYDLAVIGGGLNGTAIARDATGRGLKVFLCEEVDLGGGASSATTKLIHGGLALLEGMRLGAMREAVIEREIMMRAAPHLVTPLRFLIPHHARQWSRAAFSVGLFAFDRVARTSLPRSSRVDLEAEDAHGALQGHFALAFSWFDCVADDARLVILNALDARSRGATILPRARCTVAEHEGGVWRLSLESTVTGEQSVVRAGILVNATGAAAADVHNHVIHSSRPVKVGMAKTTCIVARRQSVETVGYALPNADGRIVFAFPWHAGTMLVGSAERMVEGAAATNDVERRDVAYLVDVTRQYFDTPVERTDIVRSFAALNAMPADGHRDRSIVVDAPPRVAPLLTVVGGTLTGHRRLAEEVVGSLARFGRLKPGWTAKAMLPGGGFPADGAGDLVRALRAAYPFLAESHARRLVGAYGTRASTMLTGARSAADLGARFGADLTEAEVKYLTGEEWALTAEDILWRRSRLGLTFTAEEARALGVWMATLPLARSPVL